MTAAVRRGPGWPSWIGMVLVVGAAAAFGPWNHIPAWAYTVDNVYAIVNNASYGNSAIKTEANNTRLAVVSLQTGYLANATYGLSAIKGAAASAEIWADANNKLLNNATYGLSPIKSAINTMDGRLTNVTSGLPAIRSAITTVDNEVGTIKTMVQSPTSGLGAIKTAADDAKSAAEDVGTQITTLSGMVQMLGGDMQAMASSQDDTNGLLDRIAGPGCDPAVVPWASLGAQCLPGRVEVKQQHDSLLDKIQELVGGNGLLKTAVDAVKGAVDLVRTAVDQVKSAVNAGVESIRNKLDELKASEGLVKTAVDAVKGAVDAVKNAVDQVKNAVDLVKGAVDGVKSAVNAGVESIRNKLDELKQQAQNDAAAGRDQAQQHHDELMDKLEESGSGSDTGGLPTPIQGGGPGAPGWADPAAKFAPVTNMWQGIINSFDVPPSGNCQGPAMALPQQLGGTIYPLSACAEPMKSVAGWSKIIGTVLLILGALFNIIRTQSAAWGLQIDVGKGE